MTLSRTDFAKAIAVLCEAVGVDMSPEKAGGWYLALNDLTAEQLAAGVVSVLRTHKYPGLPPVGVVHDAALASTRGPALSVDERAALAWSKVLEAIRQFGAYHSVEFDDPAIAAAVADLGGWQALCDTPSDELGRFTRASFAKLYAAHSRAGTSKAPALAGLLAADAARRGYALPAPVVVGVDGPRLANDSTRRQRLTRQASNAAEATPERPVAMLAERVGQSVPIDERPMVAKPERPSHDREQAKAELTAWQSMNTKPKGGQRGRKAR